MTATLAPLLGSFFFATAHAFAGPQDRSSAQEARPDREAVRSSVAEKSEPGRRDSPDVLASFSAIVEEVARRSTVEVYADGRRAALGIVVAEDGLVVTKASELGGASELWELEGEIVCRFADGQEWQATLLNRDLSFDLALLEIEARDLVPVEWETDLPLRAGRIVLSVGLQDVPIAMGIVSVAPREITGGRARLGLRLGTASEGALVREVEPDTAAAAVGIEPGDVIIEIGGTPVQRMEDVIDLIGRHRAGEVVRVRVRRGEATLDFDPTLTVRPGSDRSSSRLEGDRSRLRGGFPSAFQHDSVLRPEDCGGALLALHGKAVGLNIARAGRTASYAIPAAEMVRLIQELCTTP
ncbi:MAG: PDZ domain-containing protein [Planctomycetota bacterium]